MKPQAIEKLIPVVVVLAIIGGLLVNAFVVVEAGFVGVVRTLGAVHPKPLEEGPHFVKPFIDKVEPLDMRLTTESVDAQAASKDLQIVTTDVTVQYSLVSAIAPKIYQKIGNREVVAKTLVEPAIQESVKAITATYTAEQLVTSRAEVKLEIHKAIDDFIDKTLEQKDAVGGVSLANVAITDFNFSDDFNKAIELKVKAEQEALQAENEKLKLITEAEAAAAQKELEADAMAYQIDAESVAQAAAIEREALALRDNPELLQLRAIEAWNGQVPTFVGGGDSIVPFVDIKNITPTP